MKSIFLQATQSGWYPEFLSSVVDVVLTNPEHKQILDIGTGPGKLPELLIQKDSSFLITGIDINSVDINEARRRVKHPNISFQYGIASGKLEFIDNTFDVVTFCSVLFLLNDSGKSSLVNEAVRVLKPGGKIIVLTPSGKKTILSSFREINNFPKSRYNWTYFVWKAATKNRGKKWQKNNWLQDFSHKKRMNYLKKLSFSNNASIEILTKTIQ
jgi:ubiquinone/menaquinone biosynthesis C-methylase UbiE